jgi:hypothetical protein
LLAALVSLFFAGWVFDQYLVLRKTFQLVWTVGLFCYGIATAMEFRAWAFGLSIAA